MTLEFGKPKSLDDIKLEDVKKYPIWLWVWEAGLEEEAEDETWQCPVINSTNVTASLTEPIITLTVEGSNLFASASYNAEKNQLESIAIWENEEWQLLNKSGLKQPITFLSVPLINRQENVKFVCTDVNSEIAKRAN